MCDITSAYLFNGFDMDWYGLVAICENAVYLEYL